MTKELYNRRKAIATALGFVGSSALMATSANAGIFDWFTGGGEEAPSLAPGIPGMTTLKQYKGYSNAYEFGTSKSDPGKHEDEFMPGNEWDINIDGTTYSLDEVRGMPFSELESKDFDFRCVEAWGMRVNYNGFSLSNILTKFGDTSKKYVKFTSAERDDFRGQGAFSGLNWPYTEIMTMEEAMQDICWAVFGNYGEPSKANGAPFRVNVPWKYGYASPKFVNKIECTDEFDEGTWGLLSRQEYAGDMKIVNPDQDHPRWSQASHRHITSDGTNRVTTKYLNGYEAEVGHLYEV